MNLSLLIQAPPPWLVGPFVLLLLLIATGAVLFPKAWHKYYKHTSVALALIVSGWYLLVQHNAVLPLETLAEYISFISLLTLLYVASGGIYIFADFESKATANILFLFIAAIATNIIGTTGASVLLIRPFMRLNRYRIKPYHIIFFIFIVSNAGGMLAPIGPPLFMGFLKGVPFSWTIFELWPQWLVAIGSMLAIFYFFERRNTSLDEVDVSKNYTNRISLNGKRNFAWLAFGIATVFIDPTIINGVPYIDLHGKQISYVRELLQLTAAWFCYRLSDKKAMQSNAFSFEPIAEVAWLFFGIFLCMMPALQFLEAFGAENKDTIQITAPALFWSTGLFSALLDNAPTYLNMMALSLAQEGKSMHELKDVLEYISGPGAIKISAISAGSVLFGGMTYIGNGPNFMVKSIADHDGIKMPSFGAYIWRYSLPVLLPVLVLVWLVFYLH